LNERLLSHQRLAHHRLLHHNWLALTQVRVVAIVDLHRGRQLCSNFEWIDVVEVSHVCDKKIWIQADKSFRLDEILAGVEIVAFGLQLLQESLLFGRKEVVDRLDVRWVNSTA